MLISDFKTFIIPLFVVHFLPSVMLHYSFSEYFIERVSLVLHMFVIYNICLLFTIYFYK